MASACLPLTSQAVEINGQFYWDGGYIGNPSLFPLIYNCDTPDMVIILVVPHEISFTPTTYQEIAWRREQLFHTNTLIREMRAIEFITDLIDKGIADKSKLKKMNIHLIEDSKFFSSLDPSSALNTEWNFLNTLYERGRYVAAEWLKKHYDDIGQRSSVNVKDMFV